MNQIIATIPLGRGADPKKCKMWFFSMFQIRQVFVTGEISDVDGGPVTNNGWLMKVNLLNDEK